MYPIYHHPNSKLHGLQYDYNKYTGSAVTFNLLDVLIPHSLSVKWPIYEPQKLYITLHSIHAYIQTSNNNNTKTAVEYESLVDFLGIKKRIYILPDQRKMIDILVNSPPLTFSYLDLELLQLAYHYLGFFTRALNNNNNNNKQRCCPVILYTRDTIEVQQLMKSCFPLTEAWAQTTMNRNTSSAQLYWLTWPEKLLLILLICYNKQLPKTCKSLHNQLYNWDRQSVKYEWFIPFIGLAIKDYGRFKANSFIYTRGNTRRESVLGYVYRDIKLYRFSV